MDREKMRHLDQILGRVYAQGLLDRRLTPSAVGAALNVQEALMERLLTQPTRVPLPILLVVAKYLGVVVEMLWAQHGLSHGRMLSRDPEPPQL